MRVRRTYAHAHTAQRTHVRRRRRRRAMPGRRREGGAERRRTHRTDRRNRTETDDGAEQLTATPTPTPTRTGRLTGRKGTKSSSSDRRVRTADLLQRDPSDSERASTSSSAHSEQERNVDGEQVDRLSVRSNPNEQRPIHPKFRLRFSRVMDPARPSARKRSRSRSARRRRSPSSSASNSATNSSSERRREESLLASSVAVPVPVPVRPHVHARPVHRLESEGARGRRGRRRRRRPRGGF